MAKITKQKKKKGKYDITVKTSLTADQLFQLAITTPIKKDKK
jgi:formiminotetrahydrofolate cyclodeaminase